MTCFDWNEVWHRKGSSDSTDAIFVSGFEHTTFDPEIGARRISEVLQLGADDSVLEIGCGACLIASRIKCGCYVGTDRSASMVRKSIAMNNLSILVCEADNLIFKDKSFDKVFAFGVFHYFPDHDYACRTIAEMKRVARKAVLVSDVPFQSHDPNHLLYQHDFFSGWKIFPGIYNPARFDAYLSLT